MARVQHQGCFSERKTLMTTLLRSVLLFLFSFIAAVVLAQPAAMTATTSRESLRVTSSPGTVQMRIEVTSSSGKTVYDSEWQRGNVLDWTMPILPYGSYGLRIHSKDLEGRVAEKRTTLNVAVDGTSIDPVVESDLKITTTLHDGRMGQLVTTSGDLSFRFGDFLNRKDTEAMRLSAQGNLEVKGWIRPGLGIVFPDGSMATSAGSIMRVRASRPPEESADAKLHPKSDAAGTGTPNQVTKWIDRAGTLGDSAISEVSGAVTIGTIAAQGQLQIAGAANQDVFSGMGPNIVSGPAMNFGYAGLTFGRGAGFFNVRPDSLATAPNPSLRFMTINQERMIISNAGNVGIGTSTPNEKLDVAGTVNITGNLALPTTTSATAGVITLGGSPFVHDFGDTSNTFVGVNAGNFSMTGLYNTASGHNALVSNTEGSANTATGESTLSNNDIGIRNTATGSSALSNNRSGYSNTAMGVNALLLNPAGFQNTAVGDAALLQNLAGNNNVALGYAAGQNLTSGSSNIYIGNAGVSSESNTIRIGGSTSTAAYMGGIYGVSQANGAGVYVDSVGKLGTVNSSAAFKREIADIGDASSLLLRLRPVSFLYRSDPVGIRQYGLIAEEVADVMPELVLFSDSGKAQGVRYQFLAPLLLNEMQKQQRTIEQQYAQIKDLEERMRRLESAIASRP
jgi:hypothetical protein